MDDNRGVWWYGSKGNDEENPSKLLATTCDVQEAMEGEDNMPDWCSTVMMECMAYVVMIVILISNLWRRWR